MNKKRGSFMAVNNNDIHYRTIRHTCYIANIAYLILRVFYLILFIIAKLYILVWVDAATIVIYLLCFLLMHKKKYYLYALICGNEFFAFIAVMSVMLGFHTGFHFYLLGLTIVSFFTSYFSKSKSVKGSLVWAGLSLVIYIVLFLVTEFNTPYYVVPEWLQLALLITHIIVVFLFITFYLVIFIRYALTLEKRIMNESRTDELTQISNRYGLYDYFNELNDRSSKVLALFDIDNFKVINDTYGHVAGDYILKTVAEITTKTLNEAFVCRYGGEEFVVVLGAKKYFDDLEHLRRTIEKETFIHENVKHSITITIGASKYMNDMTLEKWVEIADEKMYSGKKSGKNKTVI